MFIDYFGTEATVSSEHGGIVYQQVSVKSCYGGSITQDMLNDIDSLIRRIPPNNAYLRFRRIGVNNILGGNPELHFDKIKERIESFVRAPATVRFTTIPIWNAVSDPLKSSWVKEAVEDYINENYVSVTNMMKEVEDARHKNFLSKQNLFPIDTQIEQERDWIANWQGAPVIKVGSRHYTPNFAIPRPLIQLSATESFKTGETTWKTGTFGSITFASFIQRNEQGQARHVVTLRGNVIRASQWVSKGCSFVDWGPRACGVFSCINIFDFLKRGVCIDCTPHYIEANAKYNLKHRFLECNCSEF